MTTDRWDPFRDMMTFREAMDRWLQQSISGTGQLLSNMRPESIPVDVLERDHRFGCDHSPRTIRRTAKSAPPAATR